MKRLSAQTQHDILIKLQMYAQPIFGFAVNRTNSRHDAEDLAQDIMLQLVKSITSGVEILQLDAYIWTVARYTWADWVKKKARYSRSIKINGMSDNIMDGCDTPSDTVLMKEAYQILHRQIAHLSELQRRIFVMYYYDEMKQSDIATVLSIPVGTVKWHLHEAKHEIMKGMNRMRQNGQLSFNPVQFTNMGHIGWVGQLGDTSDVLRSALLQNIVYAIYHRPMSSKELADELGTVPAFIEGELKFLVEYDYATKLPGGRYQAANMVVWERTAEQTDALHEAYCECAAQIADVQFAAIKDIQHKIEETNLTYPDRDFNFLLWSLLPKNVEDQAYRAKTFSFDYDRVVPMRKDGGRYIAYAYVNPTNPVIRDDAKYYAVCGPMTRNQGGSLDLWQLNTYWSDRSGWQDLDFKDVQMCYRFWRGELPDDEAHQEDYAFLLAKQYIRKTSQGFELNVVWVDRPETWQTVNDLIPDLSTTYASAVNRLYERALDIEMTNQPEHVRSSLEYLVKLQTVTGRLVAYVLKHLLDGGKLQKPLPAQRKTITTLMGLIK